MKGTDIIMSETNNKVLPKAGSYIMLAKQVYHTAMPHIISRQRYIIEIHSILCAITSKDGVFMSDNKLLNLSFEFTVTFADC